ncbi:LOW QUALITY PROTEIN: protein PAXX [Cariama cristata]
MAEPAGPFRLLRRPGRYLCYCRVTDALEVWAGELGARSPLGCRCQPEEHGTKQWVPQAAGIRPSAEAPPPPGLAPHREALERGAASLSLGEGKATLHLQEEARCSALDLFKLPIAEARSQLQALVFTWPGRVESLERRLEGGCWSRSSVPSSPLAVAAVSQPGFWYPSWHRRGRAQCGGCRGVWDALCSGQMPAIAVSSRRSGFAALPDWGTVAGPWLLAPLGEETRLGPSSPTMDAGPARLGCWRLTLGMEGLAGLAKQLADLLQSPSCLSLTEADPRPRKTRDAGSVLPAKRKIPGESLINPGFKSKKAPSGVDFEDS